MRPRAILFDLFDTLIDLVMESLPRLEIAGRSVPSTYGALHEAIRPWIELDFDSFARTLGAVDREVRRRVMEEGREYPTIERFQELMRRLGLEDLEIAEKLTQTHMEKLCQTTRFHPEHVEILAALAPRVRLGICSNFSHAPTARRLLAEAGLLPHLDAIVISEEVGFRKPRPEIFRTALAGLGVEAAEALHIGDSLEADVAGASGAGITTVWLTRRVSDPEKALERYAGPAPRHVLRDLAGLHALVG